MLAWVTANWKDIVALITGAAALVHSFQTRTQANQTQALVQKHITNSDLHK